MDPEHKIQCRLFLLQRGGGSKDEASACEKAREMGGGHEQD